MECGRWSKILETNWEEKDCKTLDIEMKRKIEAITSYLAQEMKER